jgi:hypothetical protein
MFVMLLPSHCRDASTEIDMNTTTTTTKQPGKCSALHQMWNEAGEGEPLPRNFMVEMAVAAGANPSTARTQAQKWLRSFQQRAQLSELVEPGETTNE